MSNCFLIECATEHSVSIFFSIGPSSRQMDQDKRVAGRSSSYLASLQLNPLACIRFPGHASNHPSGTINNFDHHLLRGTPYLATTCHADSPVFTACDIDGHVDVAVEFALDLQYEASRLGVRHMLEYERITWTSCHPGVFQIILDS